MVGTTTPAHGLCAGALFYGLLIAGCADSNMAKVTYRATVEIAPGEWRELDRESTAFAADLDPHRKARSTRQSVVHLSLGAGGPAAPPASRGRSRT
jgi:hypothetical protein